MGKQKKILIFCFLCLWFVGALTPTLVQGKSLPIDQLPQVVQVLQTNGATVNKWSLYARKQSKESLDAKKVEQQARALRNKFKGFKWSVKREEMNIRFVGKTKDKDSHTSETITLLAYPQKKAYQTYLIYEIDGTNWNETLWRTQLASKIDTKVTQIFGESPQIFACATGDFGDKMNIVLSEKTDAILNSLDARKIEVDQEQTFSSVSAYTELWKEQSIQSNGRSIDLQLGLRKVNDRTTVTLGTPIITSEY